MKPISESCLVSESLSEMFPLTRCKICTFNILSLQSPSHTIYSPLLCEMSVFYEIINTNYTFLNVVNTNATTTWKKNAYTVLWLVEPEEKRPFGRPWYK